MSEVPVDPLSPELRALFERERHSYVEDVAAKARVLRGVSRAVSFSLPAHEIVTHKASALSATAAVTKVGLAGIVAVAFVAGGVTGAWVTSRSSVRQPSPVAPEPARVTAPAPVSSAPEAWVVVVPPPNPAAASAAVLPHAIPSANRVVEEGIGSITRQRETLDAARAALSHRRFGEALAAIHEHETKWPGGALEEEREALAIQTLAAAGDARAAHQRAERFARRFPGSILSDVVSAALALDGGG